LGAVYGPAGNGCVRNPRFGCSLDYLLSKSGKERTSAGRQRFGITCCASPAVPTPNAPLSNVRALEILSERYAKGEINDEEYKQKKENLTKE